MPTLKIYNNNTTSLERSWLDRRSTLATLVRKNEITFVYEQPNI